MAQQQPEDLWLFGYGSLIWKPPPHYDLRVPGYIEGYVRRFWQASQDHRGTPEAPGRVATLIARDLWETLTDSHPSAPPRVWGAAYRIPAHHVAEVKEYLDIREINGYSIQYTPFNTAGGEPSKRPEQDMSATTQTVHPAPEALTAAGKGEIPQQIDCLVYIGLPSNPQFLGPQDPQALAEHIVGSRGPSGENREYLYQLEEALEGLSRENSSSRLFVIQGRSTALSQLQSRAQVERLGAVDRKGIQGQLDLLQLIDSGDQSSDKSSVLEAIYGVRFPANDQFRTRFASELTLRRAPVYIFDVRIQPAPHHSED
ncbi:hypothetical protein B0A50_04187 [Salinomyces thailandicus]|uniref:glutathione-specific gamma-glutamylcyclotransferase n=1 Tax=Salinomyces thailandicus TaxID=706561 RepID=A0A4U0U280_9PEZI|nr:hypothetical protein B0A50_04187 [Salinomyces thailandica]